MTDEPDVELTAFGAVVLLVSLVVGFLGFFVAVYLLVPGADESTARVLDALLFW